MSVTVSRERSRIARAGQSRDNGAAPHARLVKNMTISEMREQLHDFELRFETLGRRL
jgi:hypothetical protein